MPCAKQTYYFFIIYFKSSLCYFAKYGGWEKLVIPLFWNWYYIKIDILEIIFPKFVLFLSWKLKNVSSNFLHFKESFLSTQLYSFQNTKTPFCTKMLKRSNISCDKAYLKHRKVPSKVLSNYRPSRGSLKGFICIGWKTYIWHIRKHILGYIGWFFLLSSEHHQNFSFRIIRGMWYT